MAKYWTWLATAYRLNAMGWRSHPIVQKELAHQLYQVQVLGISLWRLIRVPLVDAYLIARGDFDRTNQNRLARSRIPNIAAGVARSVWTLLRLRKRRYLVIGFPRRRLEHGEWVDPFSDPIIDLLGADRVLCVEKPFLGEHCRPPRTRGIVYYDWVTALSRCGSSIGFVVPLIIFRREILELASRVRGVTGACTRRTSLLAARAIVKFWIERVIAQGLLAVVRPHTVLLTLRGHDPLIHACKKRGVPVYELQHGAISEGGYKCSKPYDPNLDPDVLLTFGKYWNASEWGMPSEAVTCVGYKYIMDRRARLAKRLARQGRKVMLVSQSHMSRTLGTAFSSIVKSYPDVQFILKLHPQDVSDWSDRYPLRMEANVEVREKSSPDLYSLFAECNCVIGHSSTVLFEASFFGLKVGILNLDGTNPCAALQFVGRYNFHEIRELDQIGELLRATPDPAQSGENPFFASFDHAEFMRLMEHGPKRSMSH